MEKPARELLEETLSAAKMKMADLVRQEGFKHDNLSKIKTGKIKNPGPEIYNHLKRVWEKYCNRGGSVESDVTRLLIEQINKLSVELLKKNKALIAMQYKYTDIRNKYLLKSQSKLAPPTPTRKKPHSTRF